MANTAKRDIVYQDDEDGEERDSDLMSDFSDEEKKHKDLKTKFKGQRQQKIPQQITQLIGEANYKYFFANQIQEAIQIAQDIIRQYPSFADPYDLLGAIFEEQGMLKESAEQQFLAAYQMNASPTQWQKIAYLYKEAGCYDSAGYCFGRVLKSDTLNTQLWCERAKCYEQTGELRKAIKCFERVIKMDETNFDALKNCAKLYLKLDKSDESVALLKTMISPNDENKNFNTINMICEIYNRKEQHARIIEFLGEYCGTNSLEQREEILYDLPLAILIFYAVSNAKLNQKEQCDLGFRKVMQRETEETEDYVRLMEDLAEMYESAKECEKALEVYRRLIALPFVEKDHSQIWERYGVVLLRSNQSEETISEIERIIKNYPDCIELRTDLSSVYMKLGRDRESLNILENILREDVNYQAEEYPEDYYNLNESNQEEEDNDEIEEDDDQVYYSDEDGAEEDEETVGGKTKARSNNLFENIYLLDENNPAKKKRQPNEFAEDSQFESSSGATQSQQQRLKPINVQSSMKRKVPKIKGDKEVGESENDGDDEYLPGEGKKQIREEDKQNPKKKLTSKKSKKLQKIESKKANRLGAMDDLEDNEKFSIDKYQLKDFFEQTQLKKTDLAANYSVNNMYLEFKKGEIILYSDREISKHKLESQFTALKQSLQLEKEYNNLKKSVLNRLLIESQKKGFHLKLTTPGNLKSFDNPNQTLLIKKKKKKRKDEQQEEHEPDILMKKKFKKSEELTTQYLKNVEVLSLKIGQEQYVKHLCHMLKALLKYSCYIKISKICSLAHKHPIWKDYRFGEYHEIVAKYGLLSALKLQNYEKAWVYIKLLVNKKSNRSYLQVILCVVMRNISNIAIYKTFLSRMVKKSVIAPKFLPIVACGFLETGKFDLAIEVFLQILKQDKGNSLANLSLSICHAQLTTARTTFQKEEIAAKAVHFMQAYAETRGASKMMEVFYNMGRFFIHLSMNDKAILNFEKCLDLFVTKNVKGSYLLQPKMKENDEKIQAKAAYNLILLHKNLGNFEIAQSLLKSYNSLV